jgi:hypothetical protein
MLVDQLRDLFKALAQDRDRDRLDEQTLIASAQPHPMMSLTGIDRDDQRRPRQSHLQQLRHNDLPQPDNVLRTLPRSGLVVYQLPAACPPL